MIYLLVATAPMYFEPITYYKNKKQAAGVAAYLNFKVEQPSDLVFIVQDIPMNQKIKEIEEAFFGDMI